MMSTSDIASITLSAALVIVTAYYAFQTRKYVKLIEEERKRSQIQQLTNSFLYPLRSMLESDLRDISHGEFINIYKNKEKHPVVSLRVGSSLTLFEVDECKLYSFLIPQNYRTKIEKFREEYLSSLEDFKGQIREVAESIPLDFVEKISNLINEFKESYKLRDFTLYGRDKIENAYYFLELIVEERREITNTIEAIEKFWRLNKDKIKSELFKDKDIKEKLENIWKKKEEVVETVKNYKKVVEELINKWVKDYGLLLPPKSEDTYSIIR